MVENRTNESNFLQRPASESTIQDNSLVYLFFSKYDLCFYKQSLLPCFGICNCLPNTLNSSLE